ncbi:MAG: amino acid permease [Syntrophotaleaceae bacterium]
MQLNRSLGLGDALLLIIGNVIGAGIFTTSGFLAGELPHPWLFLGIWVLGGVLTLCGALTYAELAGMFPLHGGDYQFLKEAYGRWAGFLLGWVLFWVINPGSIAALSIGLVSYLKMFFPGLGSGGEKLLAAGLILAFSSINFRGIRLSGTTQNIFTLGTVLTLLALIGAGLLSGGGAWGNLTAAGPVTISPGKLFANPMIAVIFTYSGWFASAYIGSEIKNPQRNLPLSLILGTLCVALVYTLINLVYLYAMPVEAMKGLVNVAQEAMGRLYGPTMASLVSVPIALAIAAGINATILTGARVSFAMGEDNVFWSRLKKIHPVYQTPGWALLVQALLSCLLVLLGTFNQLLGYVVFVMVLSSIASGLALFVLRLRQPGTIRPYRTWGYPFVPLVFVSAYLCILVQIGLANPKTSLLGILIALAGLPVYLRMKMRAAFPVES